MKKAVPYIILHIIIFIYSLCGIWSKNAAAQPFMSFEWIMFYGLLILCLMIYAVLWQQILKKVDLNVAYLSKSVIIIWSTLWGILFFNETISWTNVIGGIIVIAGVILMVSGGKKDNE